MIVKSQIIVLCQIARQEGILCHRALISCLLTPPAGANGMDEERVLDSKATIVCSVQDTQMVSFSHV
jgi:hypothetical protein